MAEVCHEAVTLETCRANMERLQQGLEYNANEIQRIDRTTEKRLDAHAGDIDHLRDTLSAVATTQQVLAETQARLTEMQPEHQRRLSELERKGSRRWEKMVETAIVAVVSAVAGALMAGLV